MRSPAFHSLISLNMASKLAFPYFRRSSTKAGTEQRGVLIPNQLLPKISWLNLGSSGISVIERLCLEEVLLRHDPLDVSH